MPIDLSVVIVNLNTKDLLQLCLENVYSKISGINFEVFVVDNGSKDGSQQMVKQRFPEVKLIQNRENVGFAAANNVALKKCRGEFILLLNPDCFLLDSLGEKEIEFMRQNSGIGILGAKLLNGDGSLQYSCRSFPSYFSPLFGRTGFFTRLFPRNSLTQRYLLSNQSHERAMDVDWVIGAFMLIRRSCLDSIGLLDEQFFLFCDDLDICYRAKSHGYRTVYYPRIRAMHLIGVSIGTIGIKAALQHHKSMYYFFKKHYRMPALLRPFVMLGSAFNIAYYALDSFAAGAKRFFLQSHVET